MSVARFTESRLARVVATLEAEIPSLTATSLDDAVGLHMEALCFGEDWEFLGVFQCIQEGVEEAVKRGGRQFQANLVPFEWDGLPPGYYVYFSRQEP